MTFFSVLLALVIEQMRALGSNNSVATLLRSHAASAGRGLDAGRGRHGVLAWLGVVVPWTLGVAVVYYLLCRVSIVLAFAWNVAVLYFTLGFRQFSHYFTDIHLALNNDDVPLAREILREWTGVDTTGMPVGEIVRQTLTHAVVSSHRHVFGVFFWFLIPIGPAGAVFYRVAAHLSASWGETATPADTVTDAPADMAGERSLPFAGFARRAFHVIDWIPVRLTALGFAIVGDFEDAVHAWRNHARQWPDSNQGTLLAAGSGALGARLIGPLAEPSTLDVLSAADAASGTPGMSGAAAAPVGDECTPRTLQSAVGLVWRAVILWMILLLMVTLLVWLA